MCGVCRIASCYLLVLAMGATTDNRSFAQETADLVLRNGKVVTVDPNKPAASAIAAGKGKILAVGSDEEIAAWIGDKTEVIDLAGRLAIPGFIEGHGHFTGLGEFRMSLDLTTAKSWEEITDQVVKASRTTPPGRWIIGRGWHQEKWDSRPEPNVEGYPVGSNLSALVPHHPVLLEHASGHMCFANDYAMQVAGVDANTQPPEGGEILRDAAGKPIGVFRETATRLVESALAADRSRLSDADKAALELQAIELAAEECLANGVTSFQDAGSSFETIARLRKLANEGKLKVRLWMMVRDHPDLVEQHLGKVKVIGAGDNFFTFNAIKLSLDGALGAHGAWLLKPYEDLPTSEGLNTAPMETAERLAAISVREGCQLCIHAIGDRANREVLDLYQRTFEKNPSLVSRRWRIEHAQHLHPDDVARFGQLGVVASMQGIHCTSDAIFVLQRLGPRRAEEGAYVWQKLLKSGAIVSNGTDVPVEKIDPIASFYASVTRKLANGTSFFPDQCMSREEALWSYTMACAYAAFEENIKGSLTPGKLADVVVLSHDIMTCPEDEIRKARVDLTILNGKVVWRADGQNR